MSISVAQLGARMHYAVPVILQRAGLLDRLYTDLYIGTLLNAVLSGTQKIRYLAKVEKLRTRRHSEIAAHKVTSYPTLGYSYVRELAAAKTLTDRVAVFIKTARNFNTKVAQSWDGRSRSIYLFNTAGLEFMEHLKQSDTRVILEQTIAPFAVEQKIMFDEYEQYAEWSDLGVNPYKMNSVLNEYIAREHQEQALADLIVCGSEFVKTHMTDSIGTRNEPQVVAYGVSIDTSVNPLSPRNRDHTSPLKVLTVGANLRKGIQYILPAAKELRGHAQFRILGALDFPSDIQYQIGKYIDCRGNVPRSELREHYNWADVFLLPSLCEGSATVSYEALSFGLPIITTPNAGTVVTHNKHGFVIPVRSVNHIVESLLALRDRDLLDSFRAEVAQIRNNISIEGYATRLLSAIKSIPHA